MKRLTIFICLLSSLISCTNNEEDNTEQELAIKTIFVFMPYTGASESDTRGSLHNNFLKNLEDMEKAINKAHGMGNNRLIVYKASKLNKKNSIVDSLIQIKYEKGRCIRKALKVEYDFDYTTPSGFSSILKDVKTIAPSQEYAMIVGSHGEGWIKKERPSLAHTRWFGGGTTGTPKYKIDITDFANAIQTSGMHMQFILFDDCYLACVENAYDLRNVTDYLIASTSEIMAYGMPYENILMDLMETRPDYSAVCSKFLRFYNNYIYIDPSTNEQTPMSYGTIGVIDCNYAEQMATVMKEINSKHTLSEYEVTSIQDLDVEHFTPTVYFDFGDYVERLCGDDKTLYNKFNDVLIKLVPFKANTKKIFSSWPDPDGKELTIQKFSGITVSDPSINSYVISTKKQTNWWKATH